MDLISVIVPVYNQESVIERCLESILSSTYSPIEIIVVDDGSTDETKPIIERYEQLHSNISGIYMAQNRGVSSARNQGLNKAKGKWVTFIDSDDYISPSFFSDYFALGDDADMISQGLTKINVLTNSKENIFLPNRIYDQNIIDYPLQSNDSWLLGFTVCKLFRNDIIHHNKILFDSKIRQCEDKIFVLEYLIHAKKIINIESSGYYYNFIFYPQKYHEKDFVNLILRQYDLMRKIEGAGRHLKYIKSIYAQAAVDVLCYHDCKLERNNLRRIKEELIPSYDIHSKSSFRKKERIVLKILLSSLNIGIIKYLLKIIYYYKRSPNL